MSIFKNIFNKIFKNNWQTLAALGFAYVRDNLLSRIRLSNPFFATLFNKVVDMGEDAIERLTDNEPDDARQMKELLEENYVELAGYVAAGALTEINNDVARMQVIAIFEQTCEKLKETVSLNQPKPA